jgi:hypothetical protein
MPTLPTPPVSTPVSSAGQAVMTIGVAVGFALIVVACVRLGRRWSTPVPALVVAGALFTGFYEPLENVAANMWYYRPGQVRFFDAFGHSLPVWVFFSYGAFFGGFGLIAWWLAERGSPRRHLVRFVLFMWVFAVVTEIVGTQLNTYEYYGRAPFRVAGFPVWVSLSNAAICTTIGVVAARLRRVLKGRQLLTLLCLSPFVITVGLVGTGFPTLVALNTVDPPMWFLNGAAIVSMIMAGVMAWGATQLVPVDGLAPAGATAAEPAAPVATPTGAVRREALTSR